MKQGADDIVAPKLEAYRKIGALCARLVEARQRRISDLRVQRRAILMAVARWLEDSAEIAEDRAVEEALSELSDVAHAAALGRASTLDAHDLPAPIVERTPGIVEVLHEETRP